MRLLSLLRFLSVLILVAVIAPTAATADATTEGQFVADTNSARNQNGLRAYRVASDLTSTARRWAQHMAQQNTLEHNPNYGSDVCCWNSVGENVGEGSSESQIQQAFMESPEHRDNILSSTFTQVGIGTARGSNGMLYVDELFRQPTSSSVGAAPAPAPVSPPEAVRASVPRASRSVARAPRRVPTVSPAVLARRALVARLRVARRAVPARLPDPVSGAVDFVLVMRELSGSAR